MSEHRLSKNKMSQIYDHVNQLTDDAKDPAVGNRTVIQSITALETELQRVLPDRFWVNREVEFDELRTFVKSVEDMERRHERVVEFCNHLTEMLFNEFEIEP